jgi:hypothetical protein
MIDCVFDSNSGSGVDAQSDNPGVYIGCEFYNNGGSGVSISGLSNGGTFINCNFIKNAAWAINRNTANSPACLVLNCGFGTGTQANASGNISSDNALLQSGTVTYASNVTPWTDPANGDFRISLAAAQGTGRGSFTQTAASYAGTVGYPDIGAAQAAASGGSSSARMVNIRGGADQ